MESLLPKLTAKVLDSESEIKVKKKSKKVIKTEISSPKDFRHSLHISSMKTRAPNGMVEIEVDGKQVYVDPEAMHKIQHCESDPIFEGDECAVDASPIQTPVERTQKTPHLSEINNQPFGKAVESTDSPTTPPGLVNCSFPVSVKRRPAPPPPPATSKPMLKLVPPETLDVPSRDSTDLDDETKQLMEQLIGLRMRREQLEVELKAAEDKLATKIYGKAGIGFEPYAKVSINDNSPDTVETTKDTGSDRSKSPTKSFEDEVFEALDSVLEEAENTFVPASKPWIPAVNDASLSEPSEDPDETANQRPVPPPRKNKKIHKEQESSIIRL